MKKSVLIIFMWGAIISFPLHAQTFTMGKKCKAIMDEVKVLMDDQAYTEALAKLDEFSGNCKTKDAKELAAVTKAEAYNQLGQYDRAIREADAALDVTKGKSLSAHFQKGIALEKQGDAKGAKSELQQVIQLTEMNQNSKSRASNYALMARVYDQQLNEADSANIYLDKAISTDPANTDFLIQKGDMALYHDQYDAAYAAYDEALAQGHDQLEVYQSRSTVGLKKIEKKYGTNKVQELRKQLSNDEKEMLCSDIKKAINLGWKDMNMDLFSAMICQ